jgi:hypothetical protein
MKSDPLYDLYLSYLENEKNLGKINQGKFSLFKISGDRFQKFKLRYELDDLFQDKVKEAHKSELRDQKIDNVISESNRGDKM